MIDTKALAYKSIKPRLTKSQRQVYEVIKAHPEGLTNAEIGYYLRWPINRITGRTFELKNAPHRMIYEHATRTCRVNHTLAKAYKIVAQLFPGESKPLPPAREEKKVETDTQSLFT
jgi:hypothetical protein